MAQDKNNSNPVQPPLKNEPAPKDVMATVQEQLAILQLQELQQKMQDQKNVKEQEQKMRESRNQAIEQEHLQRDALQIQCPHRKPNMLPAIVGQKDHRGNYHWLCQYCQKSWLNNDLPAGLRIATELVGGPNN